MGLPVTLTVALIASLRSSARTPSRRDLEVAALDSNLLKEPAQRGLATRLRDEKARSP